MEGKNMHLNSYFLEKEKNTCSERYYFVLAIPEYEENKPLWFGIFLHRKVFWFNVDKRPTKFPDYRHLKKFLRRFDMDDKRTIVIEDYVDRWRSSIDGEMNYLRQVIPHLSSAAEKDGWSLDWAKISEIDAVEVPDCGVFSLTTGKKLNIPENISRSRKQWTLP